MDWYYEKNGAQRGPIHEVDLKGMYGRAELTSKNLIWREGMSDWATYGSVFDVGQEHLVPTPRPKRTALGNRNTDFRAEARGALSGNWLMAALVTFILQVLQQFSGILMIIPVLGLIAPFFVVGPLTVGYHAYLLGVLRGESVDVSTLFDGFSQWLKNTGLLLLVTLIIMLACIAAAIPGGLFLGYLATNNPDYFTQEPMFYLGLLLLIVPTVFVSAYYWFSFMMVYFIANDESDLPVTKILGRSRAMMKGQMVKFSWLVLSFTGWHLLGLLTFGIGLFWSIPYMLTAVAAYYDERREGAV